MSSRVMFSNGRDDIMTRKQPARLWRVVLVGEDRGPTTYLAYADSADEAADQAEYATGLEAAIVDDVTPKRSSVRRPGLLTVTS